MKKLLLSAVALLSLATVNAQEEVETTTTTTTTTNSYKPVADDITVSFATSGGILDTKVALNGGQLRGRYFSSANSAYRIGLSIASDTNSTDKDNSKSTTSIGLAVGMEKHLGGTKNLSPYIGGEVGFGYENGSVKNAGNKTSGDAAINFGLRGVVGADYYFVKNVFLGVEGSWGVGYRTQGDTSGLNIGNGMGAMKLGFVF